MNTVFWERQFHLQLHILTWIAGEREIEKKVYVRFSKMSADIFYLTYLPMLTLSWHFGWHLPTSKPVSWYVNVPLEHKLRKWGTLAFMKVKVGCLKGLWINKQTNQLENWRRSSIFRLWAISGTFRALNRKRGPKSKIRSNNFLGLG